MLDYNTKSEGNVGTVMTSRNGPRIEPRTVKWEADLALRDSSPTCKADSWDGLNHLEEVYLEFSMASDILRGLMIWGGIACLSIAFPLTDALVPSSSTETWITVVSAAMWIIAVAHGVFFLRFDLRLPKDRPVRFNRKQGKVYVNTYTWNYNPFGRWRGGVKVFDWRTLQAEVTKHIGASGEVMTQRYSFDLVVCKQGEVGPFEEVERFCLQQGAQTIGQYAEQWEFIRRYMNDGLEGLPKQQLREQSIVFADCLMFMMPWFAPTKAGRRFRQRHRNPFVVVFIFLMALPFPLWLVFGLGNYVVMKIAPEAVWPRDMDEKSRQ